MITVKLIITLLILYFLIVKIEKKRKLEKIEKSVIKYTTVMNFTLIKVIKGCNDEEYKEDIEIFIQSFYGISQLYLQEPEYVNYLYNKYFYDNFKSLATNNYKADFELINIIELLKKNEVLK